MAWARKRAYLVRRPPPKPDGVYTIICYKWFYSKGILISQFQIEFDVLYLTFTGGKPTGKNRDIALILLERPMEGMVDMELSYFAPPIGAEVKMAGTGWKMNEYINKSIDSFPLI